MSVHFCINMSLPPTCFGIIKNQNSYQICSILLTQRASQLPLHLRSIIHIE